MNFSWSIAIWIFWPGVSFFNAYLAMILDGMDCWELIDDY